jgi:hypothetical protein
VSSITYNAVGDYIINFATAMSDADYAVVATRSSTTPNRIATVQHNEGTQYSTTGVQLYAKWEQGNGGGTEDPLIFNATVFR